MDTGSKLIAVAFDDPFKAEEVRLQLIKLQEEHLIALDIRAKDKPKPRNE